MHFNSHNAVRLPVLLAVLATALWCFVFAKAQLTSITHDEASTYFHHKDSDFFTCLYSPDCWKSANNHLLNTLFWQQTIRWLGPDEMGMRLPNVLAYLLYLVSSIFLVLRLTSRVLPGVAAFALLNFNPFLLDFFSLARGYGLCAAFVLGALALWYRFWEEKQLWLLVGVLAALCAAVLSNFVALNVFVSIAGATAVLVWREVPSFRWRVWWVIGAAGVLLGLILHRPVLFLRKGGEFQYGSGSFTESLESLIKNPLYGNAYLGDSTSVVVSMLALAVFVAVSVMAFRRWRKGMGGANYFLAAVCLALGLSMVVMVAQHYLLGSVYLVNRTITPLMPLLSTIFAVGLLLSGRYRAVTIASAIAVFLLSWNLVRAGNIRYFREWWYDENTKSVMLYLNDMGQARQAPVTMGVSWLFFPAGEFYRTTLPLPFVAPLENRSDINPDAGVDYYYLEESQKGLLGNTYIQEKYYEWGRVLMRKQSDTAVVAPQ